MNKSIYFTLVALVVFSSGCTKENLPLFNDMARIQLNDTTTYSATFVNSPPTITKDTVYIKVNTIGKLQHYDREIKVVQLQEPGAVYTAVPGVHYIPFDDPSLKEMMVVKTNANSMMIPIVLLRDASLKTNTYRLRLVLAANDQFAWGNTQNISRVIVFSDRLERFAAWSTDTYSSSAFINFGVYSTRKHQFMVDVMGTKIDQEWYDAVVAVQGITSYRNLLKQALTTYNNNPDNIASGAAPMRESNVPGSPLVTFP